VIFEVKSIDCKIYLWQTLGCCSQTGSRRIYRKFF